MPTSTRPLNGDFAILFSHRFLMSVFNSTKYVHVYVCHFLYLDSKKKCRLALEQSDKKRNRQSALKMIYGTNLLKNENEDSPNFLCTYVMYVNRISYSSQYILYIKAIRNIYYDFRSRNRNRHKNRNRKNSKYFRKKSGSGWGVEGGGG